MQLGAVYCNLVQFRAGSFRSPESKIQSHEGEREAAEKVSGAVWCGLLRFGVVWCGNRTTEAIKIAIRITIKRGTDYRNFLPLGLLKRAF